MMDYRVTSTSVPARAHGFEPVTDGHTRVLILGSLPGEASLRVGQYYAHPRNAFWPIMGTLTGEDLPAMPYDARLGRLKAHGIGLWDVLASAQRSGSLDAAIKSPEAADLVGLVASLPHLKAVGFNGALSAKTGRRILSGLGHLQLIDLPSTSPAHAISLSAKAEKWAIVRDFLPEHPLD